MSAATGGYHLTKVIRSPLDCMGTESTQSLHQAHNHDDNPCICLVLSPSQVLEWSARSLLSCTYLSIQISLQGQGSHARVHAHALNLMLSMLTQHPLKSLINKTAAQILQAPCTQLSIVFSHKAGTCHFRDKPLGSGFPCLCACSCPEPHTVNLI